MQADFNSAVVCMVSILALIFNSSNLFCRLLGTVLRVRTKIGMTVTFIFLLVLIHGPQER